MTSCNKNNTHNDNDKIGEYQERRHINTTK